MVETPMLSPFSNQMDSKVFSQMIVVLAIFLCECNLCISTNRCIPGSECWPDGQTIAQFISNISNPNNVLLPYRPEYDNITIMKNTRVTKFPALIVVANTVSDIQKTILFAKQHNIPLSVQSSGNDYQGRSTSHGSLQIYLGIMRNISVNLESTRNAAGEVTVESGAQWINVYQEVDKYDRVVIGGSAHTVAIGGYTLGGGHSPMSRMFGLAVDNLLEVEMVTADGSIVTLSDNQTKNTTFEGDISYTNKSKLFWALKGGGGGTFGVVTKFTFKLYPAAPAVINFFCEYPIYNSNQTMVGDRVLHTFFGILLRMPKEWGGYIHIDGNEDSGTRGRITFIFNHYGPWNSTSRIFMDEMLNYEPAWQKYCIYRNYTTFLEYQATAGTLIPTYQTSYVETILIHNNTLMSPDDLIYLVTKYVFTYPLHRSKFTFLGIMIGGRTQDVGPDKTPLHPGFRTSLLSVVASLLWSPTDAKYENIFIEEAVTLGLELRKYGNGMYRNEAGGNLTTWKTDFWGNHYDKLLRIKRYWDPDNVFTCHDCVGSGEYEYSDELRDRQCDINGSSLFSSNIAIYAVLFCLVNVLQA